MVAMPMNNASLVQTLSAQPVRGRVMDNVSVLRLDRLGGKAQGNKLFKLRPLLAEAMARGQQRILSFGGAWSNHLHALAACGAELGLQTVGFVRGGECPTPTLDDARAWGMQIVSLSRSDYRRRHDSVFQRELLARYGPGLLVPEGGAGEAGVRGCLAIAGLVNDAGGAWQRVVVPVGTGTTLAALAAGLAPGAQLYGVSALKGAVDLQQRVQDSLDGAGLRATVAWQLLHDYHCGGFARIDRRLQGLMRDFEAIQGIELEPVYTGKALLAIHDQLARGAWSREDRILLVHTGGLQGRRGYRWLEGVSGSQVVSGRVGGQGATSG